MSVARRFLAAAEEELTAARAANDTVRIRESAEKAFHAFAEACVARIEAYGLPYPDNHRRVVAGLRTANDLTLAQDYLKVFNALHVNTYYQDIIDHAVIDAQMAFVKRRLKTINSKLR